MIQLVDRKLSTVPTLKKTGTMLLWSTGVMEQWIGIEFCANLIGHEVVK